jgi:small GTP-binding protein
VDLNIWDTAGQERFRSQIPLFSAGAEVAILVFDTANPASFNNINSWVETLQTTLDPDTAMILVGNKVDLGEEITADSAEELMVTIGARSYIRTSAATGQGLDELFIVAAREVLKRQMESMPGLDLSVAGKEKEDQCC